MMDAMGQFRPRRRRPPTRGLLFGAPLDRVPSSAAGDSGTMAPRRPDPVPIALIGESSPVAPPRVASFGAMAATWPLIDRSAEAEAPASAVATEWASFARSVVLPDRRGHDGGRVDDIERRWGGLSAAEWQGLLGR